MTSYFEKYGAHPIGPTQNPAEWILEVIRASQEIEVTQDWTQTWRRSSEYQLVKEELDSMRRQPSTINSVDNDAAAKKSFATSFHF
jgi:hypothetical protein